jgi:septal ring factor EnvC (AmiA/AmiB activator)
VPESNEPPKVNDMADPIPETDPAAGRRLTLLPVLPPNREPRPVTNLGKVFGQFAELQQQIGEQVSALEDSVVQQKQDLATAQAQLPELRERINWLIASFYEQKKNDESLRDTLNRHDATLESLADLVVRMQQQQTQWATALDEVIASLIRAKSILGN